jgi:hypothetical protein
MPEFDGMIRDGKLVRKSIESFGAPSRATSKSSVPSARTLSPTAPNISARKNPANARSRPLARGITDRLTRAAI